jgi:hypothetical protein
MKRYVTFSQDGANIVLVTASDGFASWEKVYSVPEVGPGGIPSEMLETLAKQYNAEICASLNELGPLPSA